MLGVSRHGEFNAEQKKYYVSTATHCKIKTCEGNFCTSGKQRANSSVEALRVSTHAAAGFNLRGTGCAKP